MGRRLYTPSLRQGGRALEAIARLFMVQWADLSREIDYYRLEAPARAV